MVCGFAKSGPLSLAYALDQASDRRDSKENSHVGNQNFMFDRGRDRKFIG